LIKHFPGTAPKNFSSLINRIFQFTFPEKYLAIQSLLQGERFYYCTLVLSDLLSQ